MQWIIGEEALDTMQERAKELALIGYDFELLVATVVGLQKGFRALQKENDALQKYILCLQAGWRITRAEFEAQEAEKIIEKPGKRA